MIMANFLSRSRQLFASCLLIFLYASGAAQDQKATVKEYQKVFPTYPYSDPSPIPVLSSLYPYFRYEGYTDKPVQKSWKVIELENDYIKVMILPEIGGKIWTAIEKSTNQPFIYYNHAVKFRDIGMRGPYTSGGLELNYGIIGHTPNCATPVDYIIQNNPDGSVSCILGVLDLLTRSNWRLEVRLPKDRAYFTTRTFWYNSTPIEQPYYHWLNGGYKSAGNLEFIFPGTKYIGHEGEYADWPVNKTNGKNISFYESNNFGGYKSYHVFGKLTNFSGGYWHDDDFGMVRYGSYDDKAGKKIWIWGLSGQGMIWEKFLTDTDGQYVEMQSGRLFNQNGSSATFTPFKHLNFAPYATDIWTEYFYPVLKTKGYVMANEYGALNIKNEGGLLKIYFSPVQSIDDQLEIAEGQKVIYNRKLKMAPLKTFADSVKFSGNSLNLTVTLGGNKLIYRSDPKADVLSRPVDAPKDFDWNTAYGLYVQGKEYMDQKMYPQAEEKLKASLQKDHNYLPAIIKMTELNYRNMLYPQALEMATKAMSIDTHDGAANYYYGLVNARMGNITDAKDGFSIATLSAEYRSAAYTELARLYLMEKNFEKAVGFAERAVDYNKYNIEALQLQAVIYRNLNNQPKEAEILKTILSFDPLNHFSGFEKYLIKPGEESKKQFVNLISNELPLETFIELAVWYYNSGCPEEAEKVFALSPQNAETIYWLSYLQHKTVNCSAIKPAFVFPFRSETGYVLEELLKGQQDWLLKFHLALVYKDRNRIDECVSLLMSCGDKPDFAPFYVTRAEILSGKNDSQCEADLKKAVSLDNEWRYQLRLAGFYMSRQQYDKSLAIAESFYKLHPDNFVTGSLYAKTLLLSGRYREADALLTKINIIPTEGATEGHELYREAKLMQAVQMIQKKNYKASLKFISEARLWPENLGVGKPYDEDIDYRLEDWMTYVCYQKMNKKTEAEAILKNIVKFEPKVENTVRNFLPANTLVTAWAYEALNRKTEGSQFIAKQISYFPDYKLIQWSKAVFEKDNSFKLSENEKDANARIIGQLIQTSK
jgi:tetratricopeptide (TPR) repeat protein